MTMKGGAIEIEVVAQRRERFAVGHEKLDRTDVSVIRAPPDQRDAVAVLRGGRVPCGEIVNDHVSASVADFVEHDGYPTPSSGTPAAHNGHCAGNQMSYGSRVTASIARPCCIRKSAPIDPSTSSAPATTGSALCACSSVYVPRSADPALITSSTIAARLPATRSRNAAGSR